MVRGRGQQGEPARAVEASASPGFGGREQRRSTGLLRIPFVRRCRLEFDDGRSTSAFLVNLNILGTYVAYDEMPLLGALVECRFAIPGNEIEIVTRGVVAWLNPQQSHPVHSLPPGFGVRFEGLSDRDRMRIEDMVRGYVARSNSRRS